MKLAPWPPYASGLIGVAALFVVSSYCRAWDSIPGKPYERWPTIMMDVPHADFSTEPPAAVTVKDGNFLVTVSQAADQTAAGSGGRVFDVEVKNLMSGSHLKFEYQMIGERLLEMYKGYPQIEVWGRGGGGTYSRELFRVERGHYASIRDDLFDMNIEHAARKDVTTTLPGGTHTLYYTGTMYPTPGTGEGSGQP